MRIAAVNSKQCASKKNKYLCPEVFLDAVADKLTTTADLFLDAEMLSKFTYQVSHTRHVYIIRSVGLKPSIVPEVIGQQVPVLVYSTARPICPRGSKDQTSSRRRAEERAARAGLEGDGGSYGA